MSFVILAYEITCLHQHFNIDGSNDLCPTSILKKMRTWRIKIYIDIAPTGFSTLSTVIEKDMEYKKIHKIRQFKHSKYKKASIGAYTECSFLHPYYGLIADFCPNSIRLKKDNSEWIKIYGNFEPSNFEDLALKFNVRSYCFLENI
jgi:hypothetical protein